MGWYVTEGPGSLEEWLRILFVDDDGEVFLPCGAFGDERQAMLCLLQDRISWKRDGRHIYAPASWLMRHHRRHAGVIKAMVAGAAGKVAMTEAWA